MMEVVVGRVRVPQEIEWAQKAAMWVVLAQEHHLA